MEIKVALARVLVTCTTLSVAACEGPSGASSETPRDDKSAQTGEAARSADAGAESSTMEMTGPAASGAEKTQAEKPERERGGATGAAGGQAREEQSKAGEPRKRDPSAEVVVVKIEGLVYEPSQVKVSPGSTVRWVNEDRAEHTVTSEGGPLRSRVFGEGGSFEYTFERSGEFGYFCEVHPFMKGIVVVRE